MKDFCGIEVADTVLPLPDAPFFWHIFYRTRLKCTVSSLVCVWGFVFFVFFTWAFCSVTNGQMGKNCK